MRDQGYSVQQVAGELRRSHPEMSPTEARAIVRATANSVAHTDKTAAMRTTARRVAAPTHAADNSTPLVQTAHHRHHGFFDGLIGAAEATVSSVSHGSSWVERQGAHLGSVASREAYRHAGEISTVAAGAAFIPVVGEVAAPVAIGFGALAAYHDRHHPVAVALDVGGILGGGAALRLASRASRLEEAASGAWRLGPIASWLRSDAAGLRARGQVVSVSSFGLSIASTYPRPWVRNWSSLNPMRW